MTTIATIAAARRLKWEHQQVPQTPKILHFPRRPPGRKVPKRHLKKRTSCLEEKGKLEAFFDQERSLSRDSVAAALLQSGGETGGRRERVEVGESHYGDKTVVAAAAEEKWKFQADVLRAECMLLRTEREMAVKKLKQTKVQTEKALKSAVAILTSGRRKIYEGMNAKVVLEEAIADLAEKLKKSGHTSAAKKNGARNSNNLDKHSNRLKNKLQKFAERGEIQESQAMKPSPGIDGDFDSSDGDELLVDLPKTKMAVISTGTLMEKMKEEFGSRLSIACSPASNSKRTEFFDSSLSNQRTRQNTMSIYDNICSRQSKVIIRRMIEQVGAETQQWSQMQEMASRVRKEMEELQNSRVFWENRAVDSHFQIQSLRSDVEEWRDRAISSKIKEDDLQKQISILIDEIERLKFKNSSPRNDAKNEKVKRIIVCRSKENHQSFFTDGNSSSVSNDELPTLRRLPMRDIGNRGMTMRRDTKLIPCTRY